MVISDVVPIGKYGIFRVAKWTSLLNLIPVHCCTCIFSMVVYGSPDLTVSEYCQLHRNVFLFFLFCVASGYFCTFNTFGDVLSLSNSHCRV